MTTTRRRPGPPRLETFVNEDHRAAVEVLRESGEAHQAVIEAFRAYKEHPSIVTGEALLAALDAWLAIRRRMRAHVMAKRTSS